MDETTQTPAENTTETPAVEQPAPVVEEFSELTDEQVTALATDAAAEAEAIANGDEEFTEDREREFEAALARRDAANAELGRRNDRAAKLTAARARAAEFAPTQVARPAPASRTSVPRVADIPKPAVAPQVPEQPRTFGHKLTVSGDSHHLIGKRAGEELDSFSQVGLAFERRLGTYGNIKSGSRVEHGLAVIQRDYGADFTVTNTDADDEVIRRVRSERRLAGGSAARAWQQSVEKSNSLVAAAGWCAPSETLYDLCELESLDGLIELPEVMASRGGLRWTQEPTYAQLDAATTFTSLTEAQVIADSPKTCSEIPCPTFTDTRLNIAATCVTGSFLQLRGYPELVQRFVRGAMVTHAHKLNEAIIAAMVTQAGAVTPIVAPTDDATNSALFAAVELAANDIRYRNRMSFNSTIEVVLPRWIVPQMRADWSRRRNGDPGLTDQQIASWFAIRSIRPQFVYDWQDGYSGAGATFPGGDGTAPYSVAVVPAGTDVQFLAYPAGAVVLARQDVITLRNVYDSTNLAQNLYTELFFEEGWAPIYPCPDLRLYSFEACQSGAVGPTQAWDCVADTP